jgi:hypothetical protein
LYTAPLLVFSALTAVLARLSVHALNISFFYEHLQNEIQLKRKMQLKQWSEMH